MLFLYPFFFLISLVLPRDKKIWVFGCYDGYLDNTRYFFEYASSKKIFRCYWLANNQKELEVVCSLGYKGVLKKSPEGYWLSARASFSFICTGFSDVNRLLSLKGHVINFWHGTPIKKIYLDSVHDLNRFGSNFLARFTAKVLMQFLVSRISVYYASNEIEKKLVTLASGISAHKSVVLGSPRYDEIRKNTQVDIFKKFRDKYQKIILYAPTWREGGAWSEEFLIKNNEYNEINSSLEEIQAILIIKHHPLTKIEELEALGLKRSERIIYSDDLNIKDINKIYPHVDMLITDVSSSMFDFLIFKKPVVLFMPDSLPYLAGDRGIYDYFKDTLKEHSLKNWKELALSFNESSQIVPVLNVVAEEVGLRLDVCSAIYNDLIKRYYN